MRLLVINRSQYLNPRLLRWLHFFRWWAAWTVLATHARDALFVPLRDMPAGTRSPLMLVFSFIAGFGHQAVVIFFVLSGYLVGGALLRELMTTGDVRLGRYLMHRFTRLYLVLVPALVLGGLLDTLGMHLFEGIDLYTPDRAGRLVPDILACNLAFLQTIACPAFGTNGPLWSLANEFWYYILWPLLLGPFLVRRSGPVRLVMAIAALLTMAGLIYAQASQTYDIVPYMLVWLMGVLPVIVPRPPVRSFPVALVLFLAVSIAARVAIPHYLGDLVAGGLVLLADLSVALAFAGVLIALAHGRAAPGLFERQPVHARLSDFSYSLYLVHLPFLTFLCPLLQQITGYGSGMIPNSPMAWVASAVVIATTLLYAYGVSLGTERHTAATRAWLANMRVMVERRMGRR